MAKLVVTRRRQDSGLITMEPYRSTLIASAVSFTLTCQCYREITWRTLDKPRPDASRDDKGPIAVARCAAQDCYLI